MRRHAVPAKSHGLLSVMLLAGCAGLPSAPDVSSAESGEQLLKVETHASLPLLTDQRADLFQGRVHAGLGEDRLYYRARYALESGKLLASLTEDEVTDQTLSTDIGQQTLQQQVRLNLSEDERAPLRLGLESRRDMRFLLDGERTAQTTRAHLDFQPHPVAVRLDWRLPEELASADLGCHFNGNIRMPLGGRIFGVQSAVDVSQSECLVRSPELGMDASALQTRGFAWRWGNDYNSALRIRRMMPLAQTQSLYPAGPAHEVGLSHQEEFGIWGMRVEVARRESNTKDPVNGKTDDAHWVADLLLNGKMGLLDVSARFIRSGDPLWFMPISTPVDSTRFSLLVDFGAWLSEELPGLDANMSASFDRTEQTNGVDDSQVNWNVSLTW